MGFKNIRDSYKTYLVKAKEPVTIKIYMDVAKLYMKFLIDRLFLKGEIKLPERLGKLSIVGKRQKYKVEDGVIKGLAPDWKKTIELWNEDSEAKKEKRLIYHFNEHTNGIRYKFFWSKDRVFLTNKTLYEVKMTRDNRARLAKAIKDGEEYLIK